jgi:hypothetical protein
VYGVTDDVLSVCGEITQKINSIKNELGKLWSQAHLNEDTLLDIVLMEREEQNQEIADLESHILSLTNDIVAEKQRVLKNYKGSRDNIESDTREVSAIEEIPVNSLEHTFLPKLLAKVGVGQVTAHEWCLIDSGAQRNVIGLTFLERIFGSRHKVDRLLIQENRSIPAYKGTQTKSCGAIRLQITFKDQMYDIMFSVIEDLPLNMIVGGPFLKQNNARLDYGGKVLILGEEEDCTQACSMQEVPTNDILRESAILVSEVERVLPPKSITRIWGKVTPNDSLKRRSCCLGLCDPTRGKIDFELHCLLLG